jgi:uncharacterized protein
MAVWFENHSEHIALPHVEKLADLDDEWGLLNLGCRYSAGKSVERREDKAIFFFKRVYDKDKGYAGIAAHNIGTSYLEADSPKAKIWFMNAATKGFAPAMYNYGIALIEGWDGIFDTVEGNSWVSRAAKQGYEPAVSYLEGTT